MSDNASTTSLGLVEIAALLEALEQRAEAADASTLAYLIHMAAFEARNLARLREHPAGIETPREPDKLDN